jgi:single-strand DNA-binding protein
MLVSLVLPIPMLNPEKRAHWENNYRYRQQALRHSCWDPTFPAAWQLTFGAFCGMMGLAMPPWRCLARLDIKERSETMFHRITIIGHVGRDPQMRYTPDGIPVTDFSVATKETVSKALPGGGERSCPQGWKESWNGRNWEVTTWWRVTCWRGLAETVNQYVTKGQQIFVEGQISGEAQDGTQNPRVWTGQDGNPRASYEITARTVKFLGAREEGAGAPPIGEAPPEGYEEDTLPF